MMHERPDQAELLDAVATFLASDLLPNVSDKALGFRVRIAVHVLQGLAREVRAEEAGAFPDVDFDQAMRAVHDASLDADALETLRAQLMEALAADLSVTNPRFEL